MRSDVTRDIRLSFLIDSSTSLDVSSMGPPTKVGEGNIRYERQYTRELRHGLQLTVTLNNLYGLPNCVKVFISLTVA